MQLAQYLMCIATRHESWKDNHLAEISELQQEEKHSSRRRKCNITYEDEIDLLKGVISNVRGKPQCLKKLSAPAIGVLAYILKSKMTNEPVVEGYEVIEQLVLDPEKTIVYLNSIGELKDKGWIRLIEIPGRAFTDQPPFTWLQAPIELGDTFHRELGVFQVGM